MIEENFNANQTDFESMKKMRPSLELQYIYYQEMKAFVRDFIDCYNEKVSILERLLIQKNIFL